ncbi:MAG: hypothetical protein RLZZ490_898 [Cyanobacteriota bacterium]|jgi:hypothetical protein
MVFFSPLSKPAVSLALTLGTLTLGSLPAVALPWVLDPGSQVLTNPASPLTGGFTLDNVTVIFSDVMVDGLTFSAADVINVDVASGVTAIDWLDGESNLLSLVFASPLTVDGGTIALDSTVSSFTPFDGAIPLEITGSTTAVPEPLTLLGAATAIALGSTFKRKNQYHRQQAKLIQKIVHL